MGVEEEVDVEVEVEVEVDVGAPVGLQGASTNTQKSNTQLRRRLPTVFGSLFCKCGSHSAVDNTELYRFFIVFLNIFSVDALSTKKRGRPRRRVDDGGPGHVDSRAFHT